MSFSLYRSFIELKRHFKPKCLQLPNFLLVYNSSIRFQFFNSLISLLFFANINLLVYNSLIVSFS